MTSTISSVTHICPGCGATLGNNFSRCPVCDIEQPPQLCVDADAETEVIPETQIKTLVDGREAYYPWAVFGRGYVLNDERSRALVRQSRRRCNIVGASLFLLILGAMVLRSMRLQSLDNFFNSWFFVACASAIVLHYWFEWFFYSQLVTKLEPVDERLTSNELILKRASMTSPASLLKELISNLCLPAIIALVDYFLTPRGFDWSGIWVILGFSIPAVGTLCRMAEYVYAMSLRLRAYERGA
jgi:hypothetical protein